LETKSYCLPAVSAIRAVTVLLHNLVCVGVVPQLRHLRRSKDVRCGDKLFYANWVLHPIFLLPSLAPGRPWGQMEGGGGDRFSGIYGEDIWDGMGFPETRCSLSRVEIESRGKVVVLNRRSLINYLPTCTLPTLHTCRYSFIFGGMKWRGGEGGVISLRSSLTASELIGDYEAPVRLLAAAAAACK
jgi:hypothetical protein